MGKNSIQAKYGYMGVEFIHSCNFDGCFFVGYCYKKNIKNLRGKKKMNKYLWLIFLIIGIAAGGYFETKTDFIKKIGL